MRLIDADEYEKRIKPYDSEDDMDKALYNFAHYHLVTTPSALPDGPILTCKDCVYWETGWSCGGDFHYCPMADDIHGPNFYCGYAEPRKDEGR